MRKRAQEQGINLPENLFPFVSDQPKNFTYGIYHQPGDEKFVYTNPRTSNSTTISATDSPIYRNLKKLDRFNYGPYSTLVDTAVGHVPGTRTTGQWFKQAVQSLVPDTEWNAVFDPMPRSDRFHRGSPLLIDHATHRNESDTLLNAVPLSRHRTVVNESSYANYGSRYTQRRKYPFVVARNGDDDSMFDTREFYNSQPVPQAYERLGGPYRVNAKLDPKFIGHGQWFGSNKVTPLSPLLFSQAAAMLHELNHAASDPTSRLEGPVPKISEAYKKAFEQFKDLPVEPYAKDPLEVVQAAMNLNQGIQAIHNDMIRHPNNYSTEERKFFTSFPAYTDNPARFQKRNLALISKPELAMKRLGPEAIRFLLYYDDVQRRIDWKNPAKFKNNVKYRELLRLMNAPYFANNSRRDAYSNTQTT